MVFGIAIDHVVSSYLDFSSRYRDRTLWFIVMEIQSNEDNKLNSFSFHWRLGGVLEYRDVHECRIFLGKSIGKKQGNNKTSGNSVWGDTISLSALSGDELRAYFKRWVSFHLAFSKIILRMIEELLSKI